MNDVAHAGLYASAGSFLVCAAALMVLLRSGLAGRVLDRPNSRSLHVRPVPRVGGLAILLAVGVAAVAAGAADRFYPLLPLVAVSLMDDVRGVSIAPRIAIQALVAVWALSQALGEASLAPWVLAAVAVVWSTNLYNFMDGSDGLAGGMTVFGFSFLALAAFRGGDTGLAEYCFSFAAAALAFLAFNFHPARIFMGDSGSAPIGFAAATIAIEGVGKGLWTPWFPLLVFSPFVFDASITLLKRLLRGDRFWQAHREHYYQRLIRMGWGHRRTALAYYGLMLVAGSAAHVLLAQPAPWPQLGAGVALVWALGLMLAVDRAWSARQAGNKDA